VLPAWGLARQYYREIDISDYKQGKASYSLYAVTVAVEVFI
jgi:hypothetical protein